MGTSKKKKAKKNHSESEGEISASSASDSDESEVIPFVPSKNNKKRRPSVGEESRRSSIPGEINAGFEMMSSAIAGGKGNYSLQREENRKLKIEKDYELEKQRLELEEKRTRFQEQEFEESKIERQQDRLDREQDRKERQLRFEQEMKDREQHREFMLMMMKMVKGDDRNEKKKKY